MKTSPAPLCCRFPFEAGSLRFGAACVIFAFSLDTARMSQRFYFCLCIDKGQTSSSASIFLSKFWCYLSNGFLRLFALGFQFGRLLIAEGSRFVDEHLVLHFFVLSCTQVAMLFGFCLSGTPFGQHPTRFVNARLDGLSHSVLRFDRHLQRFHQFL